jgi:Sulfatase
MKRNGTALADAGVALSLANLCFLNIWTQLLDSNTARFLEKTAQPSSALLITLADILLVALVIYSAIALGRRLRGSPRNIAYILFLTILLIPLNIVRTQFLHVGLSGFRILAALLIAAAVVCWVVLRNPGKSIRIVRGLLLVLLPLLPLAAAHVALQRHWPGPGSLEMNRTPAIPLRHPNQAGRVRVVWMIFDEFDECLAFPRRSQDVRLPALDRLQSESVYATRAASPASNTIQSIPSLFTGKIVETASVANPSELKLVFKGSRGYRPWSKEPTVFSRAYALGFNSGVAGWFLPYCRLFPFAACTWEPIESVLSGEDYGRYGPLYRMAWLQFTQQLVEAPGVHLLNGSIGRGLWPRFAPARTAARKHAILEYKRVAQAAAGLLRNRTLDLVYIHWPAPHPLFYFDRRTADFSVQDGPNYFDALALVDRTVAYVRTVLEQHGSWDDTVLLVSSDHPLRAAVLRSAGAWSEEEARAMGDRTCSYVPFILKMPGQRRPIRYDGAFNTVVSGDLILAILRGEVKSAENAAQWLNANAQNGPS